MGELFYRFRMPPGLWIAGSWWSAKLKDPKRYFSTSHMMLVLTQKWARNDQSGGPELGPIASGRAPFQSLHDTKILIRSSISVDTAFSFFFF